MNIPQYEDSAKIADFLFTNEAMSARPRAYRWKAFGIGPLSNTVKIILIEAVQPKGKRLATRSSEDDILHIRTLSVEKTHYTLQLF